jgi:hypothetical protein
MIIAQISVTGYGVTLWCYQLWGKLKNYPHPFYGIYQKVIEQLNLTQLCYILQFELKVYGNK